MKFHNIVNKSDLICSLISATFTDLPVWELIPYTVNGIPTSYGLMGYGLGIKGGLKLDITGGK